jgi:lipid II:glycine glycyltransferase (peptidoglycan interpeptide bridge formation enzyme)
MQKHTEIYLNHFHLHQGEVIVSEISGTTNGINIHHLDSKKMGGSDTKDYIENLCAITITEHELCHRYKEYNEYVKKIHELFLTINPYSYPHLFLDNTIYKKYQKDLYQILKECGHYKKYSK